MQIVFTEDHLYEMSNLFYGEKNMKNVIKLSSAELAQRVVKVQLGPSIMFTLIWTLSNSLYQENISVLLFIYLLIYFYMYINGWDLPFQLIGYSHWFCFKPPVKKNTFCSDLRVKALEN